MSIFILTMVLLLHVDAVIGFGRGAPGDVNTTRKIVCDLMYPLHYNSSFQSDDTNPFLISAEKKTPSSVEVILESIEEGTLIMGFLVQGRDAMGNVIGTFDPTATENITITCGNTTVSQKKKQWKERISLVWLAPQKYKGELYLHALLLKNTTEFWEMITTEGIVIDTTSGDDCGVSEGCFRCPENKCLVTWSSEDQIIRFEMEAAVPEMHYVALGLSRDNKMGSDSTTDCFIKQNEDPVVQMGWNEGYMHETLSEDVGIVPGSAEAAYHNQVLKCSFTRYKSAKLDPSYETFASKNKIFYPGDEKYYLFVATGMVLDDLTMMHNEKFVSGNPINFMAVSQILRAKVSYDKVLIKVHGVLMVFAWLVFASFASFLPRHFKDKLQNVKIMKKPFWFALHQSLMISVAILTVLSFIIIFIEVGGYAEIEDLGSAHPPLGIIVTLLVIINPIMSLFRCDGSSRHRWIFNLFHFFVGQSSIALAAVTIFLSFSIKKANISSWVKWVLIALVCWHVITELILAACDKYVLSRPAASKSREDIRMTERTEDEQKKQSSTSKISTIFVSRSLPTTILGIYSSGVLVMSVTISVAICIS